MTTDAIGTQPRPIVRGRPRLGSMLMWAGVLAALVALPMLTSVGRGGGPDGVAGAPIACSASCDGSACADCPLAGSEDCAAQVATKKGPQVIPSKCVACGKCVKIAPNTFGINAKTEKAYVKNPTGDSASTIARAAKACPTDAIKINR